MSVEHDRLIKQKLNNMASYVEEIAPYLKGPIEGYLKDSGRRRIVERLAQVIVECAIDTNGLLVHDYDVLDNKIVCYTARRLVEDAKRYIESIYAYLSSGEARK